VWSVLLLDIILEVPMDDLIKQISVPHAVSAALCEHKGDLYNVLALSLCYEQYNWEGASEICHTLNISEFSVIEAMQAATKWADEILSVKNLCAKAEVVPTKAFKAPIR
jgi:EAL and modified HD-GYP domain-containing signal transduction protein